MGVFMWQSKYPIELKLQVLQLFEEGHYPILELCERFSFNLQTFYS